MARIGISFNGPPYSVRDMVGAVKMCEASGFESAWQAEDVYGPDAIVPLACHAQATERIRLGTCLINPNTRAATLLASTFATLDQLSGGRMVLGLGAGLTWLPMIGKSPAEVKSLTLMRETVTLFRDLLRGADVVVDGRPAIVFDRRVNLPGAFQWPFGGFDYPRARIPVYIGARGPRMIRLAGELADGLICEHSIPVPGIRVWTGRFRDAVTAAGRLPGSVETVGLVLFSPSENGRPAESLKTFLARRVATLSEEQVRQFGLDTSLAARVQAQVKEGDAEEAGRLMNREMLSAFGAIGTPDECVARLREYHEAGLTVPLLFPEACDLGLAIEVGAAYAKS
ncbi:MAG: LLM class flavin-dependent oxidoreductase, partial [Chloroflexi bacterium]|nr:LLM class flavin-dependent oxidoreductase [Chloroflexota bacterium]